MPALPCCIWDVGELKERADRASSPQATVEGTNTRDTAGRAYSSTSVSRSRPDSPQLLHGVVPPKPNWLLIDRLSVPSKARKRKKRNGDPSSTSFSSGDLKLSAALQHVSGFTALAMASLLLWMISVMNEWPFDKYRREDSVQLHTSFVTTLRPMWIKAVPYNPLKGPSPGGHSLVEHSTAWHLPTSNALRVKRII